MSTDETLMLISFFIYIHCHTTVFEVIQFAHDFCAIELRQALVRDKNGLATSKRSPASQLGVQASPKLWRVPQWEEPEE